MLTPIFPSSSPDFLSRDKGTIPSRAWFDSFEKVKGSSQTSILRSLFFEASIHKNARKSVTFPFSRKTVAFGPFDPLLLFFFFENPSSVVSQFFYESVIPSRNGEMARPSLLSFVKLIANGGELVLGFRFIGARAKVILPLPREQCVTPVVRSVRRIYSAG